MECNPEADVLATLNQVATQVMARALPVRFELAQNDAERVEVYRMRYNTVIERGWARAEDFPDGLEKDDFDARAVHIIGWDGNIPVASARLVFPSAGQPLPTEYLFGIEVAPKGRVVDLSRQIVIRTYSDLQHAIYGGLLARCWLVAQARGFYYVCGDFTPSMVRLYRMVGMPVTLLGPAKQHWGENRLPIVLDVKSTVSTLVSRYLYR